MKLLYSIAIGVGISTCALLLFQQEGDRVIKFFSAQETISSAKKDISRNKVPNGVKKNAPAEKKISDEYKLPATDFLPFVAAAVISAIKTVDKTTGAESNDVLTYNIVIANNGGVNLSDLTFSDDIDPNTILVPGSLKTSPVAFDDAYNSIGNVGVTVPDANGILSNDDLGINPAASFTGVTNAATTQGGTISITTNGGITYSPAAGFTGDDTYTYSLTNTAGTSSATITITVANMIWFINNNSVATIADGRLGTPFKTVAAFQAVNDGVGLHPKASQPIFVFESATAYDGNITLLNGQKLIGQDATTDLATIAGLSVPTYSNPLPALNSGNATITNLTATGTTNVVALNGGASGVYTIRGLTIGNKVTGTGITGSAFGTLSVSECTITGTGQALALTTGVLNASFANVSSSSGLKAISLKGITGTANLGGGTISGSTDTTFIINGGTVAVTYTGSITHTNGFPMVCFRDAHTGTITFGTGTLSATGGTGLQFNLANGTYNFNGITTLNGGDAGVDIVGTSLGSFTFSANTTITNPTGTALNIGAAGASTGGSGAVTFNGTISKTNAGRAIEIQNKTAGTVAFTGGITSTGSSTGINLVTNTGATINFSGGLTLSTAANTAFNATGGGTVSATQNNSTTVNTITTTTATAINVANTTIGGSGLTFRSINVNGAPKGIALNTTGSGGFIITGTGTTAASGGTIQNIATRGIELISAQNIDLSNMQLTNANTGDAGFVGVCEELSNSGCYAAVYGSGVNVLKLTQVNITTTAEQGINLNNVTALAISNCTVQGNGDNTEEGAFKAIDLKGTCTITNSIFKNSYFRVAHIRNNSGTCHLTVTNSQFINDATNTSPIKQDCFQMRMSNSAIATVLLKNSTFKRAGSAGIQIYAQDLSDVDVAITGCTVDREGTLMKGVEVGSDHTATMNVNVDNNPLVNANGEVALLLTSTGTASITNSTGRNNIIKGGNDPNLNAFAAVRLFASQQSNHKTLVSGNTVTELDANGIQAVSSNTGASGSSTLNSTIQSNTVTATSDLTGAGIRAQTNVGIATTNCANVLSNAVSVVLPTSHLRAQAASATSTITLSGTVVPSAITLWTNNGNTNTPSPPNVSAAGVSGSTVNIGGAACPQPTNLVLPTAIVSIDWETEVLDLSTELTDLPLKAMDMTTPEVDLQPEEENSLELEDKPLPIITENTSTASQSLVQTTTAQNITVSGIALPPAKSLTIIFQVTVNDPLPEGVCSISNQGSVSGTGITTVLTDNDANTGNGINPAVTTVLDETPPVVDNNCPGTITVQTGDGNSACTKTATWTEPTATDNCSGALTYFSRSHAPGAVFAIGTTEVTYTFQDAAGNTVDCKFDVVVEDNTAPAITGCPSDVTVQSGAGNLACSQTATWTEPTATDNCGTGALAYFSRSHAPGATFDVGTTEVTYVFKDAAGNSSTCSFDVIVQDNTPPVITGCPTNITVQTGAGNLNCSKTATWTEPSATDACGTGALVYFSRSHAPGATFNVGTTEVTYVFKDVAGNSSTCSFDVIVQDNTPPVITCPENVLAVENPTGSGLATVTYSAASASDNCSGIGTIQYSQASGTSFPIGITTVNVSVTDGAGNPATCSFTITVVPACQIIVPADIVTVNAAGQCGATVTYPAATTTGDCGTLTYSKASGSFFAGGTTTVTVSSLSTGVSNTFTVTVTDETAPVVNICPANITASTGTGNVNCSKAVSWTEPTATDICDGSLTYFSRSHAPGATFNVGTTEVTYVFKDAAGNSNTCSFDVTVQDNTAPVVSGCHATVNVQTGALNTTCTQTATWTEPTATDACGGTVSVQKSHAPGATFKKGTTAVTYTFTDAAGNESSCTFNVVVADNTPPVVSGCPATVNVQTGAVNTTCTQTAAWTEPTATDACGGTISVQKSHAPGATFNKGTTAVTYTFTDAAGNESSCTFNVIVADNTAPVITCPSDITVIESPMGSGSASATFNVTATDNCGGTPTIVTEVGTMVITSPTTFAIGTRTVTATATDAEGNTSSCTFTITVQPACQIMVPSNIVTASSPTQCGAIVNYAAATTTGDCGTLTYSKAFGTLFAVGTTTVTVSSASTGVSNSFTVTVNDETAPVISGCPATVTVQTGVGNTTCTQTATWTEPTATDNCSGVYRFSRSHAPGATFAIGTTAVTYVFKDAAGNQSTCSFNVVVQDKTPPVISGCPSNISVLAATGTCSGIATWTEPTATDNCGTITGYFSRSHVPGYTFTGVTTVTYVFKDAAGNSMNCSFTVTVQDNQPPVINTILNPIVLLWSPNHKYQRINVTQLVTSVTDNCGGSIPVGNVVITKVTSDEADDAPGKGDGNTTQDIKIATNCKSVDLRSERQDGGNGRVYTIYFLVTDVNGNTATASAKAIAAPNQSGKTAVDNGAVYTVNSSCNINAVTQYKQAAASEAGKKGVRLVTIQNYPNPFSAFTTIRYELPADAQVSIEVYNQLGQRVAQLVNGKMSAGKHAVRFDATDRVGGVYLYRLKTTDAEGKTVELSGKMIVAK